MSGLISLDEESYKKEVGNKIKEFLTNYAYSLMFAIKYNGRVDLTASIINYSKNSFNDYSSPAGKVMWNGTSRIAGDLRKSIKAENFVVTKDSQNLIFTLLVSAGDSKMNTHTGIFYAQNMEENLNDTEGPYRDIKYRKSHAFLKPGIEASLEDFKSNVKKETLEFMGSFYK
jgi:hypothetical protein